MSDKQKKRYYWLKLKEDFFEEDTIEWLEEQPNGKEYCLFYLKLCLKSLKTEGLLVRNVGNLMIPYDPDSLARLTNSNADTVKVAMDLFNKIGLIKILDGGEIFMNQLSELVGSETESARQKRIQRAREDNVHALSGKGRLEKELEKEKELEIDSSSGIDI
ncbi:TPA: phage replisome organizer N-terminal domain-containing protein, partial [Enterococcus faecium]